MFVKGDSIRPLSAGGVRVPLLADFNSRNQDRTWKDALGDDGTSQRLDLPDYWVFRIGLSKFDWCPDTYAHLAVG